MRIYPAIHYTMGGLWVDYNLMSTIPGLFVLGEANFSDHGANRLGASALMQGLADGYFVLPVHHRRLPGRQKPACRALTTDHAEFRDAPSARCRRASQRLLAINGKRTGRLVPPRARAASCGTTAAWRATREGLNERAATASRSCARSSGRTSACRAAATRLNQSLEKAGRVADFLEFAELMCLDALRPQRIVRRPLPRGIPDPRRRGAARRRALLLRRGLGVRGRRRAGPSLHTEPLVLRVRPSVAAELQVMNLTLHVWRQQERREHRAAWSSYRRAATSARTCRSWRCSTSSTRS